MPGTSGLMLCGASQSWQTNFTAAILGISGVGGNRKAIDVTDNEDAGGWSRVIVSCIRRGLPFRITIAFKSNKDWAAILGSALAAWTITWATETGYSTGATLAWSVAMTNFSFGGMLEDRMIAECELTPSGAPTITPGN